MDAMADVYYYKGRILIEREEYDKAIEYFKKSIEIEKSVEAYNALADAYARKGEIEEAKKSLRIALKIDPKSSETIKNLEKLAERKIDWLDFWTSSRWKMAAFVALIIAASVIIGHPIYHVISSGSQTVKITETINETRIDAISNSSSITKVEKINEYKIPETNLAVLGAIIFIIFHTEIRRLRMGPFELDTKEIVSKSQSKPAPLDLKEPKIEEYLKAS